MFWFGCRYIGAKIAVVEASFGEWGSEQGSDCHVATLQRRDVSSRSAPYYLKYEWFRNQGDREAYERRHGIPEQSDTDFEEVPGICTFFHCLDIFR